MVFTKAFGKVSREAAFPLLAWSWLIVMALQMNIWLSDFVR